MINSKELITYTKNLSILFVEDHEELRENTTEILKNFFKDVHSVEDGQKALELYKDHYNKTSSFYDIIISDIQMPHLNGVELTEELYKINPTQIVIILSAHDDTKYLLSLINLGIEQFIKKPIDYQEFLKVLLDASKKVKHPEEHTQDDALSKVKLDDKFSFDRDSNALYEGANSVYLTKYEIIFLKVLSSNVGKIYSNEDISEYYQEQNESLDAQNIRKLVSKLRKKLPENCIESIYGIGYRIIPYFEA